VVKEASSKRGKMERGDFTDMLLVRQETPKYAKKRKVPFRAEEMRKLARASREASGEQTLAAAPPGIRAWVSKARKLCKQAARKGELCTEIPCDFSDTDALIQIMLGYGFVVGEALGGIYVAW